MVLKCSYNIAVIGKRVYKYIYNAHKKLKNSSKVPHNVYHSKNPPVLVSIHLRWINIDRIQSILILPLSIESRFLNFVNIIKIVCASVPAKLLDKWIVIINIIRPSWNINLVKLIYIDHGPCKLSHVIKCVSISVFQIVNVLIPKIKLDLQWFSEILYFFFAFAPWVLSHILTRLNQ